MPPHGSFRRGMRSSSAGDRVNQKTRTQTDSDMPDNTNSEGRWETCPPRTLVRYGTRHRSQLRRRRAVLGAVAATAVLAVAAPWSVFRAVEPGPDDAFCRPEYRFGGISCSEVRPVLPDLLAGTLDEELAARVEIHVGLCPQCSALARRMMPGQSSISPSSRRPRHHVCSHCLHEPDSGHLLAER
jgi:hypothetical protein